MNFQEKLFYLLVEGSLGDKRLTRKLKSKNSNKLDITNKITAKEKDIYADFVRGDTTSNTFLGAKLSSRKNRQRRAYQNLRLLPLLLAQKRRNKQKEIKNNPVQEGSLGYKRIRRLWKSKKTDKTALLNKEVAVRRGHKATFLNHTPYEDIVKGSHKIRNTTYTSDNPTLQDRLRYFKYRKQRNKKPVQEGSLGFQKMKRNLKSTNMDLPTLKQKALKYSAIYKGYNVDKHDKPEVVQDKKRIERRIRKQRSTDMSRVDKYKHIKGLD